MKKLYTTFVLVLIFQMGFSQNENQSQILASDAEDEKTNFSLGYYFGVGMLYTDALDINPFLSESNVPTVRRFPFEFSLGMTGDFGKNRIDLDIGLYNQERESGEFGHNINSVQVTLRYLRTIIQFENNNRIFAGAGLSYRLTELEFYDKSETIDLDDPESFGDLAKINNRQFPISPSLGYSFFSSKGNEEHLRIQLSYEFNLSNNNWESDYARVNNSIDETGNRFRLQLILPF
ncbi:hypothetical protein LB456_04475 [Psychroflexus sp. CAK57W]|uniref:hypothetical protein n=1 Tax=Psychroflexus curvus TaxID=2873595 RepID=UPI001CC94F52|nr:hypothetical protein [Psychroflexus curvus]MBZ9786705.1 hypothetical protein [Psychroflexus curvus]